MENTKFFTLHNDKYSFDLECIYFVEENQFKVNAAQFVANIGFYNGVNFSGELRPNFTAFNSFLRKNYIQDRFFTGDWIKLDLLYKISNKFRHSSRRYEVTNWVINELTIPPAETASYSCPFASKPSANNKINKFINEINETIGEINTLVAKLQKMLA